MIKLNEGKEKGGKIPTETDNEKQQDGKTEGNEMDSVQTVETLPSLNVPEVRDESKETNIAQVENNKNDVLRCKVLFNKVNSDFSFKRNSKNNEDVEEKHKKNVKGTMFFNSEVAIRSSADPHPETSVKNLESKKSESLEKNPNKSGKFGRNNSSKLPASKFKEFEYGKPQISEPEMMFLSSLTFSSPEVFCGKSKNRETDDLKKFFHKRNTKMENQSSIDVRAHPTVRADLRIHNSLTNLSNNNKFVSKGALKSKIPSLTSIETDSGLQRPRIPRFTHWDALNDLILMEASVEKRINLQISKSSNDNSRRGRFKKEDSASVSDSKLLYGDFETKKHIRTDKKSRGDSRKKDGESGNRKQVQWNTEVDVIYFSTHLATNGDKTGEVIGRVMEPLREEWEQQRKGFYAKMVPYHMESHIKDHFISLLKI